MNACTICGHKQGPEGQVYSRHTGNHYCIDLRACASRVLRAKRAARKEARGVGA